MVSSAPDLQAAIDRLPVDDNWGVSVSETLLAHALDAGYTDLHLSDQRDHVLVRGRRHGMLVPLARLPRKRRDLLLARLKILASLPSFLKNETLDGRIDRDLGGRVVSLRVSFLPTRHGESVVIRFPDRPRETMTWETLGLPPGMAEELDGILTAREGLLLFTGPGNSGKTTSIYALLRRLYEHHGDRLHFLTLEDPAELELDFADQVQVHEAQGFTFEKALRSALRQDPDVIMVGEIRDAATARISVQAGVTGHLVLSTIHAGRAALVYPRLLGLGVEPHLVASALLGAVSQRLASSLCRTCRVQQDTGWISPGCSDCRGTGISGRHAIFELMPMSESVRALMLSGRAHDELGARLAGLQRHTHRGHGEILVRDGIISRAELDFVLEREGNQ